MKTAAKHIKRQKRALGIVLIIGLVIPIYYTIKALFYRGALDDVPMWGDLAETFIFTVIMSLVLYNASVGISKQLEKVLPWREHGRRRFFAELFLTAVSTIVLSSVVTWLYFTYVKHCEDLRPVLFSVVTVSLVVNTIVTAIWEAFFLFNQWKQALLNAEKLQKENLQSQFDSLKNQVNPHFLFNSLNTLATIIPENPEQAVEFVQKLSSVYRYLLQYKDHETVDLKTELDCVNAYLFLQKIRFGDNLQVNVNIPPGYLNRQIPPLTLQLLVENAIKHNIISLHKPLKVDIYIDDAGMLVTKNNLQKKKSVEDSTKIGLENLMNRFEYIFNQGIDIYDTGEEFIVKVPMGN